MQGGGGQGGRHRADPAAFGAGRGPGGHAGAGPRPPGDRGGGQAEPGPVFGERVEDGVGGDVVALPGRAERGGEGGEQDEGGEVPVAGELVEVPGRVHFGSHDGRDPLRGQRVEDAVIEDAGGVHDGVEIGQPVEEFGERRPDRRDRRRRS